MEEIKKIRVAVNGFGRIGRAFVKLAMSRPDVEVVAVNDLGDLHNLAYLLKYDTAYGLLDMDVEVADEHLVLSSLDDDGEEYQIRFLHEPDPAKLPWKEMEIDVVVESTGIFTHYDKARAHITAGAKRVVISAPAKEEGEGTLGKTILLSVNEDQFGTCEITSNGSCTTNAGAPLIAILHEKIGIQSAMLNTVHGYTATQSLVDSPVKGDDLRRGRAAAQNIVPSSTGAAVSITKAIPELQGKFDGIAMRVPVISGSMVDVTFIAKRATSVDEVNNVLIQASESEIWSGVFGVTSEQLVSSDILGIPFASLVDLTLTRVVDQTLVKVMAWYDNEMGYTHTLLGHVMKTGQTIK